MNQEKKVEHDKVVEFIAKNRFPFPDQTDWPDDYRTITNVPERQFGIPYGSTGVDPDIVVIDRAGKVRETAEVEYELKPTGMPRLSIISLSTPIIPEKNVRHFFLYVPDELAEEALQKLRDYNISYAGLRSYRIEGDDVIITPVDTPGHEKDHR